MRNGIYSFSWTSDWRYLSRKSFLMRRRQLLVWESRYVILFLHLYSPNKTSKVFEEVGKDHLLISYALEKRQRLWGSLVGFGSHLQTQKRCQKPRTNGFWFSVELVVWASMPSRFVKTYLYINQKKKKSNKLTPFSSLPNFVDTRS